MPVFVCIRICVFYVIRFGCLRVRVVICYLCLCGALSCVCCFCVAISLYACVSVFDLRCVNVLGCVMCELCLFDVVSCVHSFCDVISLYACVCVFVCCTVWVS